MKRSLIALVTLGLCVSALLLVDKPMFAQYRQ